MLRSQRSLHGQVGLGEAKVMAAGWQDATKLISLVTREERRKGQGKIFLQ